MRKFYFVFALMLSLMGVTQVKAEAGDYSVNFNGLTALPEGWEAVETTVGFSYGAGTYEIGSDYNRSGKALYTYQTTYSGYIVTAPVTGQVSYYVRARQSRKACGVKVYSYDGTNFTEITAAAQSYTSSNTSTSWTQKTFTLTEGTRLAFQLNNACIDDFVAEAYVISDGPGFKVNDYKDGDSHNFGFVEGETGLDFTLQNPGTEDVNCTIATTGGFTAPASVAIAAGESVTVTVTTPAATATGTVTFTPQADGLDPVTVNLSCVVKDPNKMFVDFADAALPEGWTAANTSSYYSWSYGAGYASHSGTGSSYGGTLTSPELSFEAGETLLFSTAKYGSGTWYNPSVSIQTSTDGSTWTTLQTFTDDQYGVWTDRAVTIPSADVKYIRFSGWYIHLTNIYGGELPMTANMKVTAADYSFGMISSEATTTFTIKNSGRAELTGIQVSADNAAFTIADAPATLAAGEEATVTVKMLADNKGMQNGVVTVSADEQETVTFNVSGYVADMDVIYVDFADNAIPERWVNNGFSVSNNEISTTYNTRTLTSPAITVEEGQKLAIYAKGGSTYSAKLTVKYSVDNGDNWTTAKTFESELQKNTTDYVVLEVSEIPAGNYLLQFEGYYVTVSAINGYVYNDNAPALALTPAEDAAFGKVTAAAEKTYTVANTGTGELVVNIASDSEDFTVNPATLTVNGGEEATFTLAFNYVEGNYGTFNGTITVTPTYNETLAKTIAASATVKDPNVWEEDFEEGTLPTGWEANNWTIGTFSSYENTTPMALAPDSKTASTLITPALEAKADDVLTWDAYLNWYDEALIVEYSNDEKATWTQIYNYKTQEDAEAPSTDTRNHHKVMSFTAPADGVYYLRFTSTYQNGVDNFLGFKQVVKDHDVIVSATNVPATFNQYVEANVTVTLKEMAGKDETLNVMLAEGEIGLADMDIELAAGEEKTVTLPVTFEEAGTHELYFQITGEGTFITTEHVDVTVNAAPVMDETVGTLDDFENFGNYPVVVFNYTMKAGWNTIVLPFALSDLSVLGEGAKAYQFAGYTNGAIDFSTVSSLNAQTPYVIYVEEAPEQIIFKDVTMVRTSTSLSDLNVTKSGATFQGTYAPVVAPDMQGKYGVVNSDGRVKKGGANASLKGFRAYFELPEGAADAIAANFVEEDGQVTRIEGVEFNQLFSGEVYDLSGRKMNTTLKPGVYVKDGKKFIVK